MRFIFFVFSVACFIGCENNQIRLRFLDEYVIKDSVSFQNKIVGGVSGIDKYKNMYYLVIDDSQEPRVVACSIPTKNGEIEKVIFNKTIFINDSLSHTNSKELLDLEAIFIDTDGNLNLASEGSIRKNKRPLLFVSDSTGSFIREFKYPENLASIKKESFRHNGVFEGSCRSFDSKGFWISLESPLKADGEEASHKQEKYPVRITYFNSDSGKAEKQYAYELEHLENPIKGNLNLNGVTALIEYRKNEFFIIERIYQSGYGSYGNTIRIFKATVSHNTTNTLKLPSLKEASYVPLKKELLFDFELIKKELTEGIIDNIEGVCLGDTLTNGNKTLLLVSDDNFQLYGKQLNQFILMEIIDGGIK